MFKMRLTLNVAVMVLLGSAHALPELLGRQSPPVCDADNCLREVIVTGTDDCSSFLSKTVTPCTSTVTTTVTVDVTSRASVAKVSATSTARATRAKHSKRANPVTTSPSTATCVNTTGSPSQVPSTASDCSGTARYSSACSCAGVTGQTTTLPQVTRTATVSSTSTYPASATCTNFLLQVIGADGANPYLKRGIPYPDDDTHLLFDATGPEDAQVWALGSYRNLTNLVEASKPDFGWYVAPLCISPNYFQYAGVGDGPPPCNEDLDEVCEIAGDNVSPTYAGGTLGCTVGGATQIFQTFCGYLQQQGLQNILQRSDQLSVPYHDCNTIVMRALPLCNRDHYK